MGVEPLPAAFRDWRLSCALGLKRRRMKEPVFFRRDDVLSHGQAMYWKDLLYRTVKIGTEVEFALPKGIRKKDFLEPLVELLQPTKDLANLGPLGVYDVVSEHCGVEVQVIGRQPYYLALIDQYRQIFAMFPEGVRARATCGLHYHVLATGLSEAVPEIVLANVWNLTRRYAPYLKFLTSTGDRQEGLCRRRNYNSHQEMVKLTPVSMSMPEIQAYLRASHVVPEHNNFLNLEHIVFNDDGSIKTLHYENRFPDADLSPTSIAAKVFLFLALLLKAVEMSQYGTIHVGRIKEWRRKVELLDILSNNSGSLATSDTSNVTDEVIEELRSGCTEMLELLKSVFARFESNPCFEVLGLLAETPISLLRASGRDWQEIEALLAERAETEASAVDKTDQSLIRRIELAELGEQPTPDAWKWAAAWDLRLTPQELERRLARLEGLRGLEWDPELGTMVFLS